MRLSGSMAPLTAVRFRSKYGRMRVFFKRHRKAIQLNNGKHQPRYSGIFFETHLHSRMPTFGVACSLAQPISHIVTSSAHSFTCSPQQNQRAKSDRRVKKSLFKLARVLPPCLSPPLSPPCPSPSFFFFPIPSPSPPPPSSCRVEEGTTLPAPAANRRLFLSPLFFSGGMKVEPNALGHKCRPTGARHQSVPGHSAFVRAMCIC